MCPLALVLTKKPGMDKVKWINGKYIFNVHWLNSLGLIEGFCTVCEQPWVDLNTHPRLCGGHAKRNSLFVFFWADHPYSQPGTHVPGSIFSTGSDPDRRQLGQLPG